MMTTTLPLFPLELVAYPGERLALHIFEERYRQLLEDCEHSEITFGIPTYFNKTLRYGTEMRLVEVVKRYPSGASDIICEGMRAFKLVNFHKQLENKAYAGGEVVFMENFEDAEFDKRNRFQRLLLNFYAELDVVTPEVEEVGFTSFTFAHKMGLSMDQEYELLQIQSENERYQYLIEHLTVILSTIKSVNRTKQLIKLNGHFKNFDPLDFEDYGLQ